MSVYTTNETYAKLYQQSIDDPEMFWREQASCLEWMHPFSRVKMTSFTEDVSIRWYENGKTNASLNCLDRHIGQRKDKIAIYWEGDQLGKHRCVTYQQLYVETCRCANALKQLGVVAGDVVTIYMPIVVENIVAMLACARIGAIHSVVFSGVAPEVLAYRISNSGSKIVITVDGNYRGGRYCELKKNVDQALCLSGTDIVKHVIVLQHGKKAIDWHKERDFWWHTLMEQQSNECSVVARDSEDPLFILYTSGSTGQPKALVHTTGGYLVYAATTYRYVFDHQENDVYWCTSSFGWITGHTYIVYGPLLNGGTLVIYEGRPNYPIPNRFCRLIDKYKVSVLYTAPTLIRSLIAEGGNALNDTHRQSLRLLGSVGEPINSTAWRWYYRVFGASRCPIIDSWWQTETGGIMIAPFLDTFAEKPGAAARPFFGIQACILDEEGHPVAPNKQGVLVIKDSWPGQARTIYGDHTHFVTTYFSRYPGYYFTGDSAYQDEEGDFWMTGRIDDVLNVSGHRISTAEIEGVLMQHASVVEAAAISCFDERIGEAIGVYVVLNAVANYDPLITQKILKSWVRRKIGAFAVLKFIQCVEELPKTCSGKIMRRVLKKIAEGQPHGLGDLSMLANKQSVDAIIGQSKHVKEGN